MLAKQARRMLMLLDDTPIVPGDTHPAFENVEDARAILGDAEADLRDWQPNLETIHTSAGGLGELPSAPCAYCVRNGHSC